MVRASATILLLLAFLPPSSAFFVSHFAPITKVLPSTKIPYVFQSTAKIVVDSLNSTFPSQPAVFGGIFEEIFVGDLVAGWSDHLACEEWRGPENQSSTRGVEYTNPYEGKIVLVQKGTCSFSSKVRHVQMAGGIAVIVGDDSPDLPLLTMYARGLLSYSNFPNFRGYIGYHYTLNIYIL